MINPESVKPFILHEDPDVRDRATSYFSDAWSTDPELLPLLLDACEKYGFKENSHSLYDAANFVVNEPSLLRVLRLLEGQDGAGTLGHLNNLIVGAPGELLKNHKAAIEANPNIEPDILRRVRRRIEYLDWSADQLWSELQAFSRRSDDDEQGEVDVDYSADLIQDLARRDTPNAEAIFQLIREPEKPYGWLRLLLIDLAGHRRLKEAVAPLVGVLHDDDDFLLENGSKALARINDVEAVRLIRREFADGQDFFRLSATGVLGKIRDPEAESAILAALEGEKEDGVRMWLCVSLCDQLSERCLEVGGREIASGAPEMRRELSGSLLSVATILGQELPPEASEWREVRDQQRAAMARYNSPGSSWEEGFDDEMEIDASSFLFGAESSVPPSIEVTAPIRKTGPRVGRNDPCPCGSGKKYKKCCGKP